MRNARRRERVALQKPMHALPGHPGVQENGSSGRQGLTGPSEISWGIQYHEDFQRLLRSKSTKKPIADHVALRELKEHPEAVWSIRAIAGYLRAAPTDKDQRGSPLYDPAHRGRARVAITPDTAARRP